MKTEEKLKILLICHGYVIGNGGGECFLEISYTCVQLVLNRTNYLTSRVVMKTKHAPLRIRPRDKGSTDGHKDHFLPLVDYM